MGLILSALAAAGDSGAASIQGNIDQQNKLDLLQQRSDLETAKAQTLAKFNSDLAISQASQQRADQVARIGAAQDGLIQGRMAQKYAGSDAAVADAAAGNTDMPLTQDQQDVIAQSKADTIAALKGNKDLYLQAAQQTGDLGPDKIATLQMADDKREMQAALNANKYDTLIQVANIKGDFAMQLAAMKGAAAGNDKVMAHVVFQSGEQAIRDNNTQISQLDREIATSNAALGNVVNSRDKAAAQANIDSLVAQRNDLRARIPALQDRQAAIAKNFGFSLPEIPKAAPAKPSDPPPQAPVAALPQGAVQIGTSGGKPVYQLPNGQKYISQ